MEHVTGVGAPAWAVAIEASAFAFMVRDSTWLYPLANLAHILGLTLLVGPIIALDLRLIGLTRVASPAELSRLLTPFAIVGLCLLIGSGIIVFVADATALTTNPVFLIKMGLLALGISNAILFRVLWQRRLADWDRDPPAFGRAQAMLSPLVWLATASSGRLIAYF